MRHMETNETTILKNGYFQETVRRVKVQTVEPSAGSNPSSFSNFTPNNIPDSTTHPTHFHLVSSSKPII